MAIEDWPLEKRELLGRIGPNISEWRRLYFDCLEANPGHGASKDLSSAFVGEVSGFPMLSRINGDVYDSVFMLNEVSLLLDECSRAKQVAIDSGAVALNKIRAIAELALERKSGIFFQGE